MHRSSHMHHFWHAFDPIASALSTSGGLAMNCHADPSTAEAHTARQRYRAGRAVAPNSIRRYRPSLTKMTMLSAYEHGQNAASRGKHLQACPFDTGTMEWGQWRDGFLAVTRPE
jgi:hypothetical protein